MDERIAGLDAENLDAAPEYRVFPKSWGAEYTAAGEVRFRIYVSGVEALSLRLADEQVPMSTTGDGWFELLATNVPPGTPYRFVLPDGRQIPDPAGRALESDVHGASLVVDPTAYSWKASGWKGRPWSEAVIYEIHVGTFTEEGTFAAAAERLSGLKDLGITTIQLMPVAAFGGRRGWGYDGVLLYTPHPAYGEPADMKAFIDTAHGLGLMVMLDVVYNHLGLDGNYLEAYAPDLFMDEGTPWGPRPDVTRKPMRDFVIENALYWLEEFALDGLRFDAVDRIEDQTSDVHIMEEMALRIRDALPGRHVHLVVEDGRCITALHERAEDNSVRLYDAVWNDGYHHLIHAWATGEHGGHFKVFAKDFWPRIGKTLATGFALQGEKIAEKGEELVGEPSGHLPPVTFINFLQNHDQIGNRGRGDRLWSNIEPDLAARLMGMLLLSPQIPMVFMGDEFQSKGRFFFFADYPADFDQNTPEDRLRQGEAFGSADLMLDEIRDPTDVATFSVSKLDWQEAETEEGSKVKAEFRDLLRKRHEHLMPLLRDIGGGVGHVLTAEEGLLAIDWQLGERRWQLRCNFSDDEATLPPVHGQTIHVMPGEAEADIRDLSRFAPRSLIIACG
ncbi:malto-oligosyltrehalose trehalohydrolase [Rhizobium rosettiformans]|uniref:Malto-oligosyltrehalose trehalohydrolase n=2 Tax=Rhizobium rosettiformans TaxID=1368430 RepID=A0A4S8PVD6_9HYPH|nr:malto-oligosyltrehalose trehalohydrolase [Rhizobium rosettiformans]MBB5277529.1 malto-oligosyltrehalose trehalohydrolase [Rhizobium rosettiformans]THV33742.1 malto-oligosyltrehalose trehalohydrolase [Rhizobium rosettiformans W3]